MAPCRVGVSQSRRRAFDVGLDSGAASEFCIEVDSVEHATKPSERSIPRRCSTTGGRFAGRCQRPVGSDGAPGRLLRRRLGPFAPRQRSVSPQRDPGSDRRGGRGRRRPNTGARSGPDHSRAVDSRVLISSVLSGLRAASTPVIPLSAIRLPDPSVASRVRRVDSSRSPGTSNHRAVTRAVRRMA